MKESKKLNSLEKSVIAMIILKEQPKGNSSSGTAVCLLPLLHKETFCCKTYA